MRKVNLALISPNKNAYSETFISFHKKNIDANITYLYGGALPEMSEDGEMVVEYNLFNKIRRKLSKQLLPGSLNFHEKKLLKYLRKKNTEAILAEFGTTGAAMVKVSKALNVPLIVFFHGVDAYLHEILKTQKESYQTLFREAACIFAVSNHMHRQLLSLGCPAEKLKLNPYGPADFYFDVTSNYTEKNFLAIGRFVDKKAPHITIQAFSEALKKHPEAKLRMVGDGPLKEKAEQLVKDLHIVGSVEFKGVLSPQDILPFYKDSIAFVQHSLTAANGDTEGTPVSVLEASAGALPVVSTKHAGIPDVILDGETGFLFDEGDVNAMTAAMIKVLDDMEHAKKMGQAGRARIRQSFTLDRHIGQIDSIIQQLTKA